MPLFKTTAELKEHYPARVTFDLEDLKPTLKEVEREYLVEQVLGEAQYLELFNAYDNDVLTTAQEALLEAVRPAIAGLAIYHFTGLANVEFSAGGLVVGQTEHKRPAAEWRTRDLERAMLRKGYRGLDVTIGLLQANSADYPTWVTSEPAVALREGFIRGHLQFARHIVIGSGYLYARMIPTIRRIEADTVKATLCSDVLYGRMLDGITNSTLTVPDGILVQLARSATAHLAMADCMVELSLGTDERGVWQFSSLMGGATSGGPIPADKALLQQRIDHQRNLGQGFLAKLKSTLQAQAVADNTHPYRTSTCYVDPAAPATDRYENDGPVGSFLT